MLINNFKLYVYHPEVVAVQVKGKGSHQSNTTFFNSIHTKL